MAGYVALELDQRANFARSITIKNSSGDPRDLTGATANANMRKSHYSSTTTIIPTTITNPAQGEITLSMDWQETANLTPGRYVYDVVVTYSPTDKQRVLEGVIVVNPGIS
jgi:hypothetical protein